MGQNPDTIAVVTVHGTGDTAASPDGPKWFQRGSAFSDRLKQRLARDGGASRDCTPSLVRREQRLGA